MSSLVIVDPRVSDYQQLLANLVPDTEILVLDLTQDGVLQLAGYLDGRTGFDALHILSHGSEGTLYLGSSILNPESLNTDSSLWQSIGDSLTETGDILLYGCNVAAGDVGIQFIDSLAQYTGSDVAASDDLTGPSIYGGDSNLEVVLGSVTTGAMLDQQLLDNYGQAFAVCKRAR